MSEKGKKSDKPRNLLESPDFSRSRRGGQDWVSAAQTRANLPKPEKGAASMWNSAAQSQDEIQNLAGKTPWADDHIWQLPGLSRFEFYAASEYLRQCEKNQGISRAANNTQSQANIRKGLATDPVQQQALDYLALLFARFKHLKRSGGPPQHVTATALKRTNKGWEIWIAKNCGAQGDDERIKSSLERWFQNEGAWAAKPDLMQAALREFWNDRLLYYAEEINSMWKHISGFAIPTSDQTSISRGDREALREKKAFREQEARSDRRGSSNVTEQPTSHLEKSYTTLKKMFLRELISPEHFEQDWLLLKSICDDSCPSLTEVEAGESVDLSPEQYTLEKQKHTEALKFIQLLGTVPKALAALARFRSTIGPQETLELKFLTPPADLNLTDEDRESIASTLDQWRGTQGNSDFRGKMEKRARQIRAQRSYHRYFHCELQILNAFLNDENVYDYIGCSKLSCYICWGILLGTPFRTRDTHANLWSACAFPFNIAEGPTNGRFSLALALKRVQDRMVEKVLRLALDAEFDFPGYLSLAETEPELDIQNRRRNVCLGTGWVNSVYSMVEIELFNARAIHIPVYGNPSLEVSGFGISKHRNIEPIRPLAFLDYRRMPSIGQRNHSQVLKYEVYSESRGTQKTVLAICAKDIDYIKVDKVPPTNKWYCELINLFHRYEYGDYDGCPWSGDLYVFRALYTTEKLEIDSIDQDEVQEIVQKCRDVLSQAWVSLRRANR